MLFKSKTEQKLRLEFKLIMQMLLFTVTIHYNVGVNNISNYFRYSWRTTFSDIHRGNFLQLPEASILVPFVCRKTQISSYCTITQN